MKKLLFTLSIVSIFAACNNQPAEETPAVTYDVFGDSITTENKLAFADMINQLNQNGNASGKIEGTVTEVCQKKGCWMKVATDNGDTIRVSFKDYAFFVPKDAAGRTVIIDGILNRDTITVEMLRHYAEDAGKTQEEIEKITEAKVNVGFEAAGVLMKK
jgi:hypothetical protein